MNKDVARLVRELRGDMTQEQFGKLINVKPVLISAIETGRRPPSKKTALKLAAYSGKPLTDFIK